MENDVYIQRGTLSLVVRASRALGLAPLGFTVLPNGYKATQSVFYACCSYLLVAISHLLIAAGIYFEHEKIFSSEPTTRRKFATVTLTSVLISLLNKLFIILITGLACYGSAGRMNNMMKHLRMLEEIKIQMRNIQTFGSQEKRMTRFVTVFLLIGSVVNTVPTIMTEKGTIFSFVSFLVLFMILMLEVQVFLMHSELVAILEVMNKEMKTLCLISKTDFMSELTSKQISNNVRIVSLSYVSICDVVQTINKDEGSITFLIFIYNVLNLLASGYFLALSSLGSNSFTARQYYMFFGNILWFAFTAVCISIFVEPSYQIKRKTNEMQALLSQLIYNLKPLGCRIPIEMAIFHNQIILIEPFTTFTPLGLFDINRGLIMNVFGAAITLLLLTLQLQLR